MSEVVEGAEFPAIEMSLAPGSLEARLRRRGAQLANQATERFAIPGYEDVLAVELRAMEYETQRQIIQQHEKIGRTNPGHFEVLVAADTIIRATEGFYAVPVDEDQEMERLPEGTTWLSLARMVGRKLPEDCTVRQALFAMLGPHAATMRVAALHREWTQWLSGARRQQEETVVRDFETTESQPS
jgi:hypothetical protein